MSKTIVRTMIVVVVSLLFTGGIVWAASLHDVTSRLGGITGDYFDLNGTMLVDSIKVGSQGVGGVTFFNGTIINNTTNSNNDDNPVTFGDNVRIDGTISRGANEGPGDDFPVKLNDDVRVFGNLSIDAGQTLTVTDVTITGLSSDDLSDADALTKLADAETIGNDWDNTAYPWAADEIADVVRYVELPLASFLSDADNAPTPLTAATEPNLNYVANQGLFIEYSVDDTVDIGTQFVVPEDYASGGTFYAIIDTSADIVTDWDLDFAVAISNVDHDNTDLADAWDTDMDNETAVNLIDSADEPSVVTFQPTDTAEFVPGATVFFGIFPASNTGAGEPDVEIYNVWFEYTASQ